MPGWYFKDGSTRTGVHAPKPPTYPTQAGSKSSAKNQRHQTNNPMEEALTTRHHMHQQPQHTLTDITTDTDT